MVGAIHHIEIVASDADEMAAFLRTVGFDVVRETDHHGTSYELTPSDADGPVIEVHTAAGEEIPGVNHLAFEVDDLEGTTEELADADVDGLSEPHFIDATGRWITNFRDPDGRRMQLVASDTDADG